MKLKIRTTTLRLEHRICQNTTYSVPSAESLILLVMFRLTNLASMILQSIWKATVFTSMLSSVATCRLAIFQESPLQSTAPMKNSLIQTWRSLWRICRKSMLRGRCSHQGPSLNSQPYVKTFRLSASSLSWSLKALTSTPCSKINKLLSTRIKIY